MINKQEGINMQYVSMSIPFNVVRFHPNFHLMNDFFFVRSFELDGRLLFYFLLSLVSKSTKNYYQWSNNHCEQIYFYLLRTEHSSYYILNAQEIIEI